MHDLSRHQRPRFAAASWVSLWMVVAFWAPTAGAQPLADEELAPANVPGHHGEGHAEFPLRLTQRPLTLPRGKIALTSRVAADVLRVDSSIEDCVVTMSGVVCISDDRSGPETTPMSSAGVAVGVIDALEIGLVPLRFRKGISPEGGRESPLRDPLLTARAAALRLEHFQLGFGYRILLPLRSDTAWMTQSVSLDLLARSRFIAAEASTFVRFDSPIRKRSRLTVGDRVISPGVAARVTGQVADPFAVFFAFESLFFNSSVEGHVTNVSAGFVGTIRRSTGEPLADIRFTFGALDLQRYDEPGVRARGDERCSSTEPTDDCGIVPGSSFPVKRYTFELGAVFYFHDAW